MGIAVGTFVFSRRRVVEAQAVPFGLLNDEKGNLAPCRATTIWVAGATEHHRTAGGMKRYAQETDLKISKLFICYFRLF